MKIILGVEIIIVLWYLIDLFINDYRYYYPSKKPKHKK